MACFLLGEMLLLDVPGPAARVEALAARFRAALAASSACACSCGGKGGKQRRGRQQTAAGVANNGGDGRWQAVKGAGGEHCQTARLTLPAPHSRWFVDARGQPKAHARHTHPGSVFYVELNHTCGVSWPTAVPRSNGSGSGAVPAPATARPASAAAHPHKRSRRILHALPGTTVKDHRVVAPGAPYFPVSAARPPSWHVPPAACPAAVRLAAHAHPLHAPCCCP